jgi:hypothetical protein
MHQQGTTVGPRQPFEWHSADGGLHGLGYQRYRPCPDDEVEVLCGRTITLTHEDFRRDTHRSMCTDCLAAWRHHQETP